MNRADGGRSERGARSERLVAEHLERRGYRLLGRNVRVGRKEIDLLLRSPAGLLVCCEVRARTRASSLVHPAETVTEAKRRHVREALAGWLQAHASRFGGFTGVRFDVAAVWLDARGTPLSIEYYEGAF